MFTSHGPARATGQNQASEHASAHPLISVTRNFSNTSFSPSIIRASQLPTRKSYGFRLLAIAGGDYDQGINISAGPKRISTLYDMMSQVILDVQVECSTDANHALASQHFPHIKPKSDLVIFDQGYPTYELMYQMHTKGLEYLIQAREAWWKVIRKMKQERKKEKVVSIRLNGRDSYSSCKPSDANAHFTCRLCEVTLPNGDTVILSTSVLDRERLPSETMAEIYHCRWKIGEVFRALQLARDEDRVA